MSKLSTSSKYFGINKLAEMQEETGRLNRVLHQGFKVLMEGGMNSIPFSSSSTGEGWGVDGKKRAKKQNGRLLQGRTWDAVPYPQVGNLEA